MAEPCFGVPFAALDQLYNQILAQVPARSHLFRILTVIAAKISLMPAHIKQLLELEPGDLQLTLHGLHSLMIVPEDEDDEDISIHHASFRDFLQDPARAGIFYVGGCQHRTDLSRHILKALSYKYDDPSLNQCGHVSR
jgi:DNA-binding transcriptional LysR family regulator